MNTLVVNAELCHKNMNATNHFLSCDWGTSVLRVRLVEAKTGYVIAEVTSNEGIAVVFKQWQAAGSEDRLLFYLSVLQKHILLLSQKAESSLQGLPVVVSGMASSSIGLEELLYKELPFLVDGSDLVVKNTEAPHSFPHRLMVISGARTADDVMRGEETQLVGCTGTEETAATQLFIFPGTHSKHIVVGGGKATAFRTYMTGELFALLSQKSILSTSVEEREGLFPEKNRQAFEDGVWDSRQFNLLHACFRVRTNGLFGRLSPQQNRHYLSGLLIGTELADLLQAAPPLLILVSSETIKPFYEAALHLLFPGKETRWENADAALIRGQRRIYTHWKKQTLLL